MGAWHLLGLLLSLVLMAQSNNCGGSSSESSSDLDIFDTQENNERPVKISIQQAPGMVSEINERQWPCSSSSCSSGSILYS